MKHELGRFGHHPDPAMDFCVEVEILEGLVHDVECRIEPLSSVKQRVERAMTFTVGGDLNAISAKSILRHLEKRLKEFAEEQRREDTHGLHI